jgi:hypothetical protein
MKYPNQRYGNVEHLNHYAAGWTLKALAKHLKRDERTVKDWLSGAKKCPWWAPELLRLERYEKYHQMQEMRINPALAKLGIIRGEVLHFPDIFHVRDRLKTKAKEKDGGKGFIKDHNEQVIKQYRSK